MLAKGVLIISRNVIYLFTIDYELINLKEVRRDTH